MDQKPTKPGTEKGQRARAAAAWTRLAKNKADDNEGTFCYELFELRYFDEKLFLELCQDMDIVLLERIGPKQNYRLIGWIISCIFRSVFSHLDAHDLYKISNFDAEISPKWSSDFLEKLRSHLEKVFVVLTQE